MQKPAWLLGVGAMLLGAIAAHYVWPQAALGQQPAPVPREVRAQSFTFLNERGEVQASLAFDDRDGRPSIRLLDRNGREIWSAGASGVRPLTTK